MARTFRLAVLECDTPIESVKERHGPYGELFRKLLTKGLTKLRLTEKISLDISRWNVVAQQQYPDLETVDGVLLSGSKHNSFENQEWILSLVDFVRMAFENKMPIVGICFGHQIIGRAMGASVGRNTQGWEVSVERIQLTQVGSKLMDGKRSLALHQMHRDIVLELPDGFENIGTSERCQIQGLYQPRRVFSVQAHPEFLADIMESILTVRHDQQVFDDELFEGAMGRARLEHDGMFIAVAIWKFLLHEL